MLLWRDHTAGAVTDRYQNYYRVCDARFTGRKGFVEEDGGSKVRVLTEGMKYAETVSKGGFNVRMCAPKKK